VFIFTAKNLPPGATGIVSLNGKQLASVTIDSGGTVVFVVITTGMQPGNYTVTLTITMATGLSGTTTLSKGFTLAEDAPLREKDPTIVVPPENTLTPAVNLIYLPLIERR